MNVRSLVITVAGSTAVLLAALGATAPSVPPATLERGRALVVYGTCNDCHTAGWREADGAVPQSRWMTGSKIGFRGWWGTSYPANVRLAFRSETADEWIAAVRTRAGHPPMVWQDLRGVPDADLRAIYLFIRSLGPAGTVSPANVEPWREPVTTVIDMRAIPAPAPPR